MFSSLLRDGIVAAIVLPIILVGLILITLAAEFVGIDPHEEWFSLILIPFVILGLYQLATLMPTGLWGHSRRVCSLGRHDHHRLLFFPRHFDVDRLLVRHFCDLSDATASPCFRPRLSLLKSPPKLCEKQTQSCCVMFCVARHP